MRLLNSTNLELEEFIDDRIPRYAILSHRWQDQEVSLQDMQRGTASQVAGYRKLQLCCEQAVKDGVQYAWIDTCCIDKTSSAELTEAINSMYRWYQNAEVCYAYLSDVQSMSVSNDSSFKKSAWFTRGWTLQELIAPSNVEFYNATWHYLGTKESLKDEISAITSIDIRVLKGVDLDLFSIAKRMSWAAKRTTTRVEDASYSLLGLFGVNMPMIYGEGERAFIRLQEEIIKHSADHSIFAWKSNDTGYRGLFAKSPADFGDCSNVVPSINISNSTPYSITNMGLSIELPLMVWAMNVYLAGLDCELENLPDSKVGIFLEILSGKDQYARVTLNGTDRRTFESKLIPQSHYKKIYVQQKIRASRPLLGRKYGFWLRKLPFSFSSSGYFSNAHSTLEEAASWNPWNMQERILEIPIGLRGTAGAIWYRSSSGTSVLKLGFDDEFNPVCLLGGPVWESGPGFIIDLGINNEWIENTKRSHPLRGDRLTGLNRRIGPTTISITEEVIKNQIMWTVDIDMLGDSVPCYCGEMESRLATTTTTSRTNQKRFYRTTFLRR